MAKTAQKYSYIQRARGTVQGLDLDFELGHHTLFVGPNGSGKDARVRLVMLAARGAVDDIMGQDDVGDALKLCDLLETGQGELKAEIVDTLGDVGMFRVLYPELGRSTGKKHVPLEGLAAPITDLTAILQAGDEKRRAWFLSLIGDAITENDVLDAFPGALRGEFRALAEALKTSGDFAGSPVDLLNAVRKEANRRKLEKSKEAAAQKKVGDAVIAATGRVPTADDVLAAQREMEEAQARLAQVPAAVAPEQLPTLVSDVEIATMGELMSHNEALVEQAAQAEAQIVYWRADAAGRAPISDEYKTWAIDHIKLHEAMALVAKAQIDAIDAGRLDRCLFCGNPDAEGAAIHAGQVIRMVDAEIDRVNATLATEAVRQESLNNMEGWIANKRQLEAQRESNLRRVEDIQGRLERQQALRAEAAQRAAGSGEGEALESRRRELEEEFTKAARKYHEDKAAHDNNLAAKAARDAQAAAEADVDRYGRLVDKCDEAAVLLVNQGRDAFVEEVNKWMPPPEEMPEVPGREGARFGVQLKQGNRDVCRIGLVRRVDGEERVHTVLSGAQEAIVHCALATADGIRRGKRIILVSPRERDLTPEVLRSLMTALADSPAQIILTQTKRPKGGRVRSWTIVDVTEDNAANGTFEDVVSDSQAETEAAEVRAAVIAEGGSAAEADEEAEDVREAVKASGRAKGKEAHLPWWAQKEHRGRPAGATLRTWDEVYAKYPGRGEVCDALRGEGDAEDDAWYRFDSGIVVQAGKGMFHVYVGKALDPTRPEPPTTPVWAKPPELGPLLFVCDPTDLPKGLWKQAFGADYAGFTLTREPDERGRSWCWAGNGAVAWVGDKVASVYAGTTGVTAEATADLRTSIGKADAGIASSVVAEAK